MAINKEKGNKSKPSLTTNDNIHFGQFCLSFAQNLFLQKILVPLSEFVRSWRVLPRLGGICRNQTSRGPENFVRICWDLPEVSRICHIFAGFVGNSWDLSEFVAGGCTPTQALQDYKIIFKCKMKATFAEPNSNPSDAVWEDVSPPAAPSGCLVVRECRGLGVVAGGEVLRLDDRDRTVARDDARHHVPRPHAPIVLGGGGSPTSAALDT